MTFDIIISWLAFTPEFAMPLILAALGLIINERAGVLNLGAEGLMLVGAMTSVAVWIELADTGWQSPWFGMLGAAIAGAAVAALFAFMVVILRASQVVTGVALVFFCIGLTGLLGSQMSWTDTPVPGFSRIDLGWLSEIPVIGRIVFHQDPWVYLTLLLVVLVHFGLFHSVTGLKLRAVGHNPQAADTAGVSVIAYRFGAVVVGGALVGLAGGYLAQASAKIWVDELTQGRGWIAIALVIFARWRPWRAVFGALLFGGIEALIPRLNAAGFALPQYFLLMTPYLATLVVLVYAALATRKGANAPLALGLPFVREERR